MATKNTLKHLSPHIQEETPSKQKKLKNMSFDLYQKASIFLNDNNSYSQNQVLFI